MKYVLVIYMLSMLGVSAFAQSSSLPDDILGQYWTDGKEGKIEIFKEGEVYFGRIVWRKNVAKDIKNRDRSLRERDVVGLVFLEDFRFDRDAWIGGSVYSIDNGRTYSGKLWLEENGEVLKMRGHLKLSRFIGRTASLTRVEAIN